MNKAREVAAIKIIKQIFESTQVHDVPQATALLSKLENKFKGTANYKIHSPGCYIEVGDIANDTKLVQKGIDLANRALSALEKADKSRGLLEFNRGNGFYSLYKIARSAGTVIDYYNYLPLQNAKLAYSNALATPNAPDKIRIQTIVNLANIYDTLGRTVEAIKLYERALQIDSSFAMAKANLGEALYFFAAICGKYRAATMIQSYQLIKEALENTEQLEHIGGREAVLTFQRELTRIGAHFKNKSVLKRNMRHPTLNMRDISKYEREYVRFCFSNKMFLNFHIHMSEVLCKAAVTDDLSISLVEKVGGGSRFFFYCKYINQMKEDYATARFLLFQSIYRRPFLNRISKITRYIDTLDYVGNNLYIGMLKAAFNRAYSILDKIAVFLDVYLNLETKGKIYFTTIWATKKEQEWIVREEIRNLNNPSLLGIYDVNHDFRSPLYSDIIKIRNAAEHDRLSVVEFGLASTKNENESELVISKAKLQDRTIDLMLIAKSCISNLVNFVNIEENKKIPLKGITLPMTYYEQEQSL